MRLFFLLGAFFLTAFTATEVLAQGHVSSGECPYNCQMKGLKKKQCRDWRWENRCYVEDLSRSANRYGADRKGFIVTGNCPFNCQMAGLPKSVCRDWRENNRCVVEDLTRRPQTAPPTPPPAQQPAQRPEVNRPPIAVAPQTSSNDRELAACRERRGYVARPRIDIHSAERSGNMLRNRVRVRGTIEGMCIVEAGYFEEGRKKETIPVAVSRDFRRFDFEIVADNSRRPELRAYNVQGEREIIPLDRLSSAQTSSGGESEFSIGDLIGIFSN